ncbi:carbohydrate-binding protein, partial [candidate division KSB1 bacterium]|nr:carbohydrate-binding protein [candidate division KSB1 bacterium]
MKKTNCLALTIVLLAFVIPLTDIWADVPAFPGAEGFGSTTVGGRNGRVIKVTNTNDSGTGSFRAAVEDSSGARIVVFTTGGTISLSSSITIDNPYITIAGQTAPGGGICLKNGTSTGTLLKIKTHDIIIRCIRIRPGDGGEPDGVYMDGSNSAYNIIFDHCSFSWAVDENITAAVGAHDITVQWCITSQALRDAGHSKGWHSMGMMFGSSSSDQSYNISAHHNLYAHNLRRNPLIQIQGVADVVNTVVYNWGGDNWSGYPVYLMNETQVNYVNNYVKPGPASNDEYTLQTTNDYPDVEIYVDGNITHYRTDDTMSDSLVVEPDDRDHIVSSRFTAPSVTTWSALAARDSVLKHAGVTVPVRDSIDSTVVASVTDSTNEVIDDPSDAGGWPTLASGTAPTDTDGDGMPDSWEDDNNLDKNSYDANDNDLDTNYDNIEVYINSLIPNPCDTTGSSTTTFSLTTNTSGSGSISLDPSGGTYDSSTVVTLTATPDFGYVFSGWSGNLSGSNNPDSITMNSNKSVTATFVEDTTITEFDLTTNTSGSGSITLDPSGGTYDSSTVVTLTANPGSGYQFDNWSGDLTGSANPDSITMNANKSVTANFSEVTSTVYDGCSANIVTGSCDTENSGYTGSGYANTDNSNGTYVEWTNVVVSATNNYNCIIRFANGGSNARSVNVSVNDSVQTSLSFETTGSWTTWSTKSCSLYLTSDTNKVKLVGTSSESCPNIDKLEVETGSQTTQFTLTTNTSGSGSISLSPSGGTYDSSTVVTLTATADSGYQFSSWSGDLTGSANPDSITMNANKSVTATFSQIAGSGEVEIVGSWTNGSSHTAESGSNRLLVFTAHTEHNAALTLNGVSYGGKAMTEVIEKSESSGGYVAVTGIYILKEADIADASGSSFSVTWSTTPARTPEYSSVFLTGVNQTTPTGDTQSAGGTSSTISTSSLSTSDGDMAILAATCGNLGDYSTGGGFTEALEFTIDDPDGGDGVAG